MLKQQEVPAAVLAVQDLKNDVTSPEDEMVLKAWRAEVGSQRAAAVANLGSRAVQVEQVEAQGVVVPVSVIHQELAEGHEFPAAYNGGAHSNR